MKTFQEIYKTLISTEKGRQDFAEACDNIIRKLSYGYESTEHVSLALSKLVDRLNNKDIEPSPDGVLVGYIMVDSEGMDLYCALLYSEDKILALPKIKPWDNISFDPDNVPGKKAIYFYDMTDLSITIQLSCYHQLPRCFAWGASSVDYVLGSRVYSGGKFYDEELVKAVIFDILYAQLMDGINDDYPLSFVDDEIIPMPQRKEEDCDYIDEDARDSFSADIRRTQLQSFLNLYQALKEAKESLR